MSIEKEPEIIIKSDEVDAKYRKKLGDDKLFGFKLENKNEILKVELKELDAYSPYSYEAFFSKDDLNAKHDIFKSKRDIDGILEQLYKLFEKSAILKKAENDNIIVSYQIPNFFDIFEINFELEKKTTEKKDEALQFLFDIQKSNINKLNLIKELCKKHLKEPACQKILQLLNN